MAYTHDDLIALGLEFDNDPKGLGYPAGGVENAANDVPFAEAINLVRDTLKVKRRSVASSEIAGAIEPNEHEALSDGQKQWLKDCVLDVGTIDAFTSVAVRGLTERFPANTSTGARLPSLFDKSASRLEQMFQEGLISEVGNFTPSTPGQIRAARTQ